MMVTISAKGQVVIPARIRKHYNLRQNSRVEFLDTGHSIILKPVPEGDPFLSAYGFLKGKFNTKEFLEIRREEKIKEAKKVKDINADIRP